MFSVNAELIRLYWDIGQMIDDRQQRRGWGASVIPRLSAELRNELPELKGFSTRNMDRMVAFFTGTLVTDCYAGYFASAAGAKQKCLAHLARTARDWRKLTESASADYAFFEEVQQFVKRGCKSHRRRREEQFSRKKQEAEKAWLRAELLRLQTCDVSHEKALTLQARLLTHSGEWLVFLDDPRVPPTNNLAERALRPLVVLRKITFGHRSDAGARRMAKIMTVGETARRHGHRASDIYLELMARPPTHVLRRLYANA